MDSHLSDGYYEPSLWDRVEPVLFSVASLVMYVGFGVAALGTLYLLYGVLSGGLNGFNALPAADQHRLGNNINVAASALKYGLGFGTLGAAYVFLAYETAGYIILGLAVAIGLGIPYGCTSFGHPEPGSHGVAVALGAFLVSAYVPAAISALLIIKDIGARAVASFQEKPIVKENLTYGMEAHAEARPVRTSLLAKCWEGPYCREFIRTHCPIFIARKACWREKMGCYCEEEIVSNAAAKVQGIVLDMAPDPQYNFANAALPLGDSSGSTYRKPQLSPAQKRERCRQCVIYNEHEREKYRLLVPVVFVGGIALCLLLSSMMRTGIGAAMGYSQAMLNHLAFTPTSNGGASPGPLPEDLAHPNATVEWVLVGAITVMIVSKLLQGLEWMCFEAKI